MDANQVLETLYRLEKPFDFRDFYSLDDSEDADFLIKSMYRMHDLPAIQEIKDRAINLLKLQKGDSAIEVGSGLGLDCEAIGEIVGNEGKVVGIDASRLMQEEARRRTQQKPNIQYHIGDAANLNFPDDTFAASYADRLLVSQLQVNKVIDELIRVVKPGGKICATDIDVGSAVLFPYREKLTPILKERLQEIISNPFIGREIHHIFKQHGLTDIAVYPEAYVVRSFELVNTMIDYRRMIADLYKMGKYTKDEALTLLNDFLEADANKTFLYGIILFTTVGTKP